MVSLVRTVHHLLRIQNQHLIHITIFLLPMFIFVVLNMYFEFIFLCIHSGYHHLQYNLLKPCETNYLQVNLPLYHQQLGEEY